LSFLLKYLLPLLALGFAVRVLTRSLWIVVPPFTYSLLGRAIAAPELSLRWLLLSLFALGFALLTLRFSGLASVAIAISFLSVLLSSLPLVQFPFAHRQMEQAMQQTMGKSLAQIPPETMAKLRPAPLNVYQALRGIPVPEVEVTRGLVFAEPAGESLRLNRYHAAITGKRPTLVMIHGGGWRAGSADSDELFSRYMAAQGYTVISITYRLAPKHRFPAQLEDVQAALSAIQARADEWQVDLERVALVGRSAGGTLAMLAAYQTTPFPIRAVVNYYAPVDLTRAYLEPPRPNPADIHQSALAFLGGTPAEKPDLYQQASPVSYIRRSLPSSLFIYAGRDHLVRNEFAQAFAEQLQAIGNQVVYLEVPWSEHAFDALFHGLGSQLTLYHLERFLAGVLLL